MDNKLKLLRFLKEALSAERLTKPRQELPGVKNNGEMQSISSLLRNENLDFQSAAPAMLVERLLIDVVFHISPGSSVGRTAGPGAGEAEAGIAWRKK